MQILRTQTYLDNGTKQLIPNPAFKGSPTGAFFLVSLFYDAF